MTDLSRIFRGPLTGERVESIVRTIPVIVYLVAIHLLSSVEGDSLPSLIDDRIAHFVEYFGLCVLLYVAVSGFDRVGRRWTVCFSVVLFAAVYAVLDEWHQSFVPGRDSSIKDIGFDIAGASCASLLIRWRVWRKVER